MFFTKCLVIQNKLLYYIKNRKHLTTVLDKKAMQKKYYFMPAEILI